jgi:hypothetical protein
MELPSVDFCKQEQLVFISARISITVKAQLAVFINVFLKKSI